MTRYRTRVSEELLAELPTDGTDIAQGVRIVEVRGVVFDPAGGLWRECIFEDDWASPDLEGKMVTPAFRRDGTITVVAERTVESW